MTPKVIAVIPARYASTRFPGKPLAMLGDRRIIQWVYDNVCDAVSDVYVATDDDRIVRAVEDFGGRAVVTSTHHSSGTSRVDEACRIIGTDADIVVNVQGDEPFVSADDIRSLVRSFDDPSVGISTLVCPFPPTASFADLSDPDCPKVVLDSMGNAVWFSRSVMPYLRGVQQSEWASRGLHHMHIGVYAFRARILHELVRLPQSDMELAENLEQLRWIENGYAIRAVRASSPTIGIDTPLDLQKALCRLKIFS